MIDQMIERAKRLIESEPEQTLAEYELFSLLEQMQQELKPVIPTFNQGKSYCGSCGLRIPGKIGARFCHKCGKPIKWGGEHEN